ncbi:MAG: hypothetical protein PHW79_01315 [Candidatus Marinimicrobia bacterium]|nr:hypothetical protein [Candidatus Neomarinimicrobiota bacterium]
MSQNVDKLLQDSSVRLATTKKYATELAAAIAFQDKPEILQQFKPVTRRKSSKKTEPTSETTTETETGTNP